MWPLPDNFDGGGHFPFKFKWGGRHFFNYDGCVAYPSISMDVGGIFFTLDGCGTCISFRWMWSVPVYFDGGGHPPPIPIVVDGRFTSIWMEVAIPIKQ